MFNDLPPSVENVLRRVHPSGDYDRPEIQWFDEFVPNNALEALTAKLQQSPQAIVDVVPAEAARDRSHTVYIGLSGAPSWLQFNRELEADARLTQLRDSDGTLDYWILMISRIGPFWTSYWNRFTAEEGRVIATLTDAPSTFEWDQVIGATKSALSGAGLEEIKAEVLDIRVPWLSTALAPVLEARGRGGSPTVYHALFEEVS